jgi:hypothetical protein
MRCKRLAWTVAGGLLTACATSGGGSNPSLGGDDGGVSGSSGSFFSSDDASVPYDSSPVPLPPTSGSAVGDDSGALSGSSGGTVSGAACPMDLMHDIAALIAIGKPACPSAGCAQGECCYTAMSLGTTVCVKQ